MAKNPTEEPAHGHGHGHGHAAHGSSSFTVTFPGQAPVTVAAAGPEDAVQKAKEQLGVVSSEAPPDVVAVTKS